MTIGELRALPVGRGHIGQVRYLPLGLSGKGRGRGNNQVNNQSVDNSVADLDPGSRFGDPGSGIRSLFDPWIQDPGWVKNQGPTTRIIFLRA